MCLQQGCRGKVLNRETNFAGRLRYCQVAASTSTKHTRLVRARCFSGAWHIRCVAALARAQRHLGLAHSGGGGGGGERASAACDRQQTKTTSPVCLSLIGSKHGRCNLATVAKVHSSTQEFKRDFFNRPSPERIDLARSILTRRECCSSIQDCEEFYRNH